MPLAKRHAEALRGVRSARHRVARELSDEALSAAKALLLHAADLNWQLQKVEVECRMLLLGLGGDEGGSA
jgi:hypothetical protein